MGKVKIEIHCYVIADILTKLLQKCLLNGPPSFVFKPPNFIGCHGNQKVKILKINSLEAISGIKPKICRILPNISLYKDIA